MIHHSVDIERWIAMYPLEPMRTQAQARVLSWRAQNPTGWLDGALRRSTSEWRYAHPDRRAVSEDAALDAVRAERAKDPHRWDSAWLQRQTRWNGPSIDRITSPVHLAIAEQVRTGSSGPAGLGQAVPADVFLWSTGEPPRREMTKIGGAPYWPANRSWPSGDDGTELQFVAQFCFADSHDIVGETPADLLLIFAHSDAFEYLEVEGLHFEWISLETQALIAIDDIPRIETDWSLEPFWGSIHRMDDYPDLEDFNPEIESYEWGISTALLATKIGGAPYWQQGDPALPGRFLAALEGFYPLEGAPFPYLNQEEPFAYPSPPVMNCGLLQWGDGGRLNLQFDGERVHAEIQCG